MTDRLVTATTKSGKTVHAIATVEPDCPQEALDALSELVKHVHDYYEEHGEFPIKKDAPPPALPLSQPQTTYTTPTVSKPLPAPPPPGRTRQRRKRTEDTAVSHPGDDAEAVLGCGGW